MNTLENQVQDALNSLENSLHPTIWRTKRRIQEIMKKDPLMEGNIFVMYMNHLFTLLVAGVVTGDIGITLFNDIGEERYEEGQDEPILLNDIPTEKGYGTSVEFNERIYAEKLITGFTYSEVRDYVKGLSLKEQSIFIQSHETTGMMVDRVFYRLVQTPKSGNHKKLPELVVE